MARAGGGWLRRSELEPPLLDLQRHDEGTAPPPGTVPSSSPGPDRPPIASAAMATARPRLPLRARAASAAMRAVNVASRRAGRGAGTVAGGRVGFAIEPR